MEVFKARMALLEDFKKNKIDLTTLSGETFRLLKEYNPELSQFLGKASDDVLYLKYLYFLCRLERRVNFEYRLIKAERSDPESFKRVCQYLFDEMSIIVQEIITRDKELTDIALGPGGIVLVLPKNSPVGRIYLSRSSFIESNTGRRPDKKITHPYLRALFSFLQTSNPTPTFTS